MRCERCGHYTGQFDVKAQSIFDEVMSVLLQCESCKTVIKIFKLNQDCSCCGHPNCGNHNNDSPKLKSYA